MGEEEEEYCFIISLVEEENMVECDGSLERLPNLSSTPFLIGKASTGTFKIFSIN